MMTKDAGALKTIGEVAEATGIAAHVLRYWERNVPSLRPLRRAGGRRYYRAADVDLVRALHRLVAEEGYTLDGAARAAQAIGAVVAPTPTSRAPVDPLTADDSGGAISLVRLTLLRDRLKAALAA